MKKPNTCFRKVLRKTKSAMGKCGTQLRARFGVNEHLNSRDLYTLFEQHEKQVKMYADAFTKLAASEGLPKPNRKALMYKLRRMRPSEMERIYDACSRFGIQNLI